MNTFCHSTIAARIETAAAAIILFLTTLTSCGRSSSPEPLDQWNDGTSTLHTADPVIAEGRKLFNDKEYQNFRLTGEALTQPGSEAGLLFHTDGESGYEVIFRNGDIDGTRKSGSLASVRNLYRSLAKDGEWFDFEITVRGQNIIVCINGTEVVCYTEPGHPYRTEEHARQLLSQGSIALQGIHGEVSFRNLAIERLAKEARNEADTLAPVDERTDEIIRLQQHDFPVIDYHVHLKGGLTKEMAHAMSMNYGINYGVAPNAGEGGVGRMLADDKEVYDYFNEVKGMPFLCGVQGEGRKWTATFSQEALGIFDYLFTDAMTIIDHKGRNSRIYRAEEALFDDITLEQYMDHLVDQTVLILTNEPADIYANPTFLPDTMAHDYDKYWTDGRIERVLDVLQLSFLLVKMTAVVPCYSNRLYMTMGRERRVLIGGNHISSAVRPHCLMASAQYSSRPKSASTFVAYAGLLLLHFTDKAQFSTTQLLLWLAAVVLVQILDYFVPMLGSKYSGGSRWGTRGCLIGTIVGLFFMPWGIILGPFLGAFAGELMGGSKTDQALKSGLGSLLGFLLGTVVKCVMCAYFCWEFVKALV